MHLDDIEFTDSMKDDFLKYINGVADQLAEEERQRVVTPAQLDFVYSI